MDISHDLHMSLLAGIVVFSLFAMRVGGPKLPHCPVPRRWDVTSHRLRLRVQDAKHMPTLQP